MARVLVADDDPSVREVLGDLLEGAGHRVIAVATGQELLDRLRVEGLPALIVLDLDMPGKDGFQVLAELQADGLRRAVPVLVLTCRGRSARLAATPGISLVMDKPFLPERLLEAVGRLARPGD